MIDNKLKKKEKLNTRPEVLKQISKGGKRFKKQTWHNLLRTDRLHNERNSLISTVARMVRPYWSDPTKKLRFQRFLI